MILKTMFTFLAMGTVVFGSEKIEVTEGEGVFVPLSSQQTQDLELDLRNLEHGTREDRKAFLEELYQQEILSKMALKAQMSAIMQSVGREFTPPSNTPSMLSVLLPLLPESLKEEISALYEEVEQEYIVKAKKQAAIRVVNSQLQELLQQHNQSLDTLAAELSSLDLETAEQTVKQEFVSKMFSLDVKTGFEIQKLKEFLLKYKVEMDKVDRQVSLQKILPLLSEGLQEEIKKMYAAVYMAAQTKEIMGGMKRLLAGVEVDSASLSSRERSLRDHLVSLGMPSENIIMVTVPNDEEETDEVVDTKVGAPVSDDTIQTSAGAATAEARASLFGKPSAKKRTVEFGKIDCTAFDPYIENITDATLKSRLQFIVAQLEILDSSNTTTQMRASLETIVKNYKFLTDLEGKLTALESQLSAKS